MQQLYLDNDQFRTNVRMISALAIIPVADFVTSFEALSDHCDGDNEQGILDYFENNYIGQLRRGRRRRPLFAHTMWNISGRVADNLPRTNNALEGWHKQLNSCFAMAHPTIWRFIKVVREDATVQQIRVAHYVAGRPAPKRRRIYESLNEHISTLYADFNNRNIIDYLRGISYNLSG